MRKIISSILLCLTIGLVSLGHQTSIAAAASKYGIHILHPGELSAAKVLLSGQAGYGANDWHYVTIPLSLADTEKKDEWQKFFTQAHELKLIPLVRLVSEFDGKNWRIPDRKETVKLIDFVSEFVWPTDDRYIIVFNEVNHAAEWGGQLSPENYIESLAFASQWARTQSPPLKILPAALDLAAPNGSNTLDAFTFWKAVYAADPDFFSYLDGWNSHSYPNPGFISPPTYGGRDGLAGFEQEQAFLRELAGAAFSDRNLPIFITETGWKSTYSTERHLPAYYKYAMWHVWSAPEVTAVTPFLLQGEPGPFAQFGFVDAAGNPTAQYRAFQAALDGSR